MEVAFGQRDEDVGNPLVSGRGQRTDRRLAVLEAAGGKRVDEGGEAVLGVGW